MTHEPHRHGRTRIRRQCLRQCLGILGAGIGGAALATFITLASAQPAPTPSPVPAARSPAGARSEEGVRWQSLTPAQREALAPLEHEWPGIDARRKQKWVTLAARFKAIAPDERARITARMSEWARLTPSERGQARLQFEEARQVPAPDRNARWQAYQALPADTRQQLAARAASAASGTADSPRRDAASGKAAKPARDTKDGKVNLVPYPALAQPPKAVAPTLVQAAPGATTTLITRRPAPPAHQQTGMPKIAATPEFVNRSTLLPKRGAQAAAVSSAPAPVRPGVIVSPPTVGPVAPTPSPRPPATNPAPAGTAPG